jgi:hypothetical protein
LSGSFFLAKVLVCKIIFSAGVLASQVSTFFNFGGFVFIKTSLPKIELRVKSSQVGCGSGFQLASLAQVAPAQQSVHWTAGILRRFSSSFLASSFSYSRTESTPAPPPSNANRWAVPCKIKIVKSGAIIKCLKVS